MNFQQLEYILALDEHKQFSEAAFSCNVTQATLSAMIIKMEKEIGFQIFDRTTKPVTTTELGQAVVSKAREILSVKRSIPELGRSMPQALSGKLILGIIPTVANSLLSRILPVLLERNPNLRLEVKEITTEEIMRQLKRGTIDLGIAATPLEDENIQEEILYYEPMLVYGADSMNKKYILTDDLLHEKTWLLEEGHCFREQVATVCGLQKKETDVENLAFEGNSFETLLSMVDAFGGHTLVPELYFLDMDEKMKLRTKRFRKPIPVREISIVSYAPAHRNLTVRYLAELIRNQIQPLLSTDHYSNKDLRMVGIH